MRAFFTLYCVRRGQQESRQESALLDLFPRGEVGNG